MKERRPLIQEDIKVPALPRRNGLRIGGSQVVIPK